MMPLVRCTHRANLESAYFFLVVRSRDESDKCTEFGRGRISAVHTSPVSLFRQEEFSPRPHLISREMPGVSERCLTLSIILIKPARDLRVFGAIPFAGSVPNSEDSLLPSRPTLYRKGSAVRTSKPW